jgi:hypothetical protein
MALLVKAVEFCNVMQVFVRKAGWKEFSTITFNVLTKQQETFSA